MDKLIVFSNKTEGRDKFCKVLQYGSRMLKALLSNPVTKERLNGLFTASRDARKMFRLWKSVHEYDAMVKLLQNVGIDNPQRALQFLSRLAFFFYWLFDNLAILSAIKFIKRDTQKLTKSAMTCWFIALIFTLINLLRNLVINLSKDAKLKRPSTDSNAQSTKQTLDALKGARTQIYINLVKTLGDMIPAAGGAQIALKIFGKNFSEKWIGLGGLVSALISCYQAWP
ncbi:unnamed protein product [Blepharisma stoltei]|uniref:Peroxisomal biogenesis factor 11 n=1 Tax=Blepharisma stoltei TaxID=1481888 RepID=A0AAU9IAG6_9CILI|nr:unnamed protein product [Blepharisma stoltei]